MSSVVEKKQNAIPLSVPKMGGNEWEYIKECLDTNWVSSSGKFVNRFEEVLSEYIGRKYGIACVNGTAALHIAILVSGIKPNDEVIMPALTFIAPANAVRYVGAWPVFIDVQTDIWQIDPQKVDDFLKKECDYREGKLINRRTKRNIKAILPVHIMGHPVDLEPILEIARQYDLKVIEDVAESLGAKYKDQTVGRHGDIACFSFNGNKIITSGGGGMILTDNEKWAEYAHYLTTQAKDDSLENIHHEIGFNYRLTNIQAAMGLAQMEKLNDYVASKRKVADIYRQSFSDMEGLTQQKVVPWAQPTYWLYTILVEEKQYGMNSRELFKELRKSNIETRPFWHPIYSLKPFSHCYSYNIEVADRLYSEGLSLPSSVGITQYQQQRVIKNIKQLSLKK